jgi:hypothetical protein
LTKGKKKLPSKKESLKHKVAVGVMRAGKASFKALESLGQGIAEPKGKSKKGKKRSNQDMLDWIEKELSS